MYLLIIAARGRPRKASRGALWSVLRSRRLRKRRTHRPGPIAHRIYRTEEPKGFLACPELVGCPRRYEDEVHGSNPVILAADAHSAPAAQDEHRVRVAVLLERRVAARGDLEVPQLEGRRLVPSAYQYEPLDPAPGQRSAGGGLVGNRGKLLPAEPRRIEARDKRLHGRTTTLRASPASRSRRYPFSASESGRRCVTRGSTRRPAASRRSASRVSSGPAE